LQAREARLAGGASFRSPMPMRRIIVVPLFVSAVFAVLSTQRAAANPSGGVVAAGAATINGQGTPVTTINQAGNQVIINWQNFSIGTGELTRFIQPSATASALNRVVSGNPSEIYGQLQANGQVFVINPNGILVGASGKIDTKSFIASTLDIPNSSFLSGGPLTFSGSSTASVKNDGSIQALGGDVFLIGNTVANSGTISAPQGTVGLAAGSQVQLVQSGNERLSVLAGAPGNSGATGVNNVGTIAATSAELKAAGGNIYALAINNGGVIRANGIVNQNGHVYLRSSGGNINNSGTISANNADGSGGTIVVDGGHNATTPATVINSGTISAAGTVSGTAGGSVEVLGDDVGLFGSSLVDVSGAAGGGTALIGGDLHGANPDIQDAEQTYVSPNSVIKADAITSGNGGKIVVWSDDATQFFGTESARGGATGGNGGFIETSGHGFLDFQGDAITLAPVGQAGTLLLDPSQLTIDNGSDANVTATSPFEPSGTAPVTSELTWATITGAGGLGGGNVVVTTTAGTDSGANGDITVGAASPDLATANSLTIDAAGEIILNAGIKNTGTGTLVLDAEGANAGVAINQTAGTLQVNTLQVTAPMGSVNLNQGNAVNFLNVTSAGGAVGFTDNSSLGVQGISASGQTVTLTGNGGVAQTLMQSGIITASGLTIANWGPVTLTMANVVPNLSVPSGSGMLSFTTTGPLDLQGITLFHDTTLVSGGAVVLGGGTVKGNLSVTAKGNISETGVLNNTTGSSTFTIDTVIGSVLMGNEFNDFGSQTVTVNSINGGTVQDVSLDNDDFAAVYPTLPGGLRNLTLEFDNNAISLPALTLTGDLMVTDPKGITIGGGSVTSGSGQTYDGAVTLGANTVLQDTGNGAIAFDSTVDADNAGNNRTLTVETGGAAQFDDKVGGSQPLQQLTVDDLAGDSTGTITLGNAATDANMAVDTQGGGQSYDVAVTLGANTVANESGSGAITFKSTVDGDAAANQRTLIVETGGAATFDDQVGGSKALGQFAVDDLGGDAGGTITLGNAATDVNMLVKTQGGQAYDHNAVTLGANTSLSDSSATGISLTSVTGGSDNLTLAADTMSWTGPITTTGNLIVHESTPGRAIAVGAPQPSSLVVTAAELANVTAGSLQIGDANSGTLTVNAAPGITLPPLTLESGGAINQDLGASLIGSSLTLQAGGAITVTDPGNQISALTVLAAGGPVQFTDDALLTVNGISASGRTVTLTSGAGGPFTLLEHNGTSITASTLDLSGWGSTTLNQANQVSTLTGTLAGPGNGLSFVNAAPLALGTLTVPGTLAITAKGNITESGVVTANAGASTFTIDTVVASVLLGTQANDFGSQVVTVNTVNGGTVQDVSLRNVNASAVFPTLPAGLRNLTLEYDAAPITLPTLTVSGTLGVTAGGTISESGVVTATGGASTFTIDGTLASVLMGTQANNFGSQTVTVNTTGGGTVQDVSLRNVNAGAVLPTLPAGLRNLTLQYDNAPITVPGVTVTGTLGVTAGGTISESGVVTATGGASTFTIDGTLASVLMGTQANNFGSQVVTFNTINGGTVQDVSLRNVNAAAVIPTLPAGLRNLTFEFDAAPITLPALTLSGNLMVTAGGLISQAGGLNVSGVGTTATFAAGAGNNITLNGPGNDFGTVVISSGDNVSVANGAALNLGASTVSGTLTVRARGNITESGAVTATGGASTFTIDTTTGSVLLGTQANNFGSQVVTVNTVNGGTVQDVSLRNVNAAAVSPTLPGGLRNLTLEYDAAPIALPTLTVSGTLGVTAGGNISESGAVTATGGASTFTIDGTLASVLMGTQANNFGSQVVTVNTTGGGTVQDVSLRNVSASAVNPTLPGGLRNLTLEYDNAAIALPGVTVTGTLGVTAGGTISENGVVTATGGASTFTIDGTTASVLMGTQANNFGSQVVTVNTINGGTVQDVSLRNVNAAAVFPTLPAGLRNLTLEYDNAPVSMAALTLSGNLMVTAGGLISQTGGLTVNGAGSTATFVAGAGNNITLNGPGNDLGTVVITSGDNVSVVNGAALNLGVSTVSGTLNVSAAGNITESGVLTAKNGASTFTITSPAGSVLMGSQANDFGSQVVTVNTTGGGTVQDVSLRNVNAAAVYPTLPAGLRNLTLEYDATPIALPGMVLSGSLQVTAGGLISQSGALVVPGTATFNAGGTITLNSANQIGTLSITGTGGAVQVTDLTALNVAGISAAGQAVTLTGSGGALSESGAINASTLTLSGWGPVTLNSQVNSVGTLSDSSAGSFGFADGTGLVVSGISDGGQAVSLAGSGNPTLGQSGIITGSTLTLSGWGATTLTGHNQVGSLSVQKGAGTLQFDNAGSLIMTGIADQGQNVTLTGIGSPPPNLIISGTFQSLTPTLNNWNVIGAINVLSSDLAALSTVVIPAPVLNSSSFSSASLSVDEVSKILPPGSIGTLWLELPFEKKKAPHYKVEDVAKWMSVPVTSVSTEGGGK
jgi:filamentous hemagglutinin family protein